MRRTVARLAGDAAWLIRNDAHGAGDHEDRQVRRVRLYTVGSIVSIILFGIGLGVWMAAEMPTAPLIAALALLTLSGFTGARLVLHVTTVGDQDWKAYRWQLFKFLLPFLAGLVIAVADPDSHGLLLLPSFALVAYGSLGGLRVTVIWVSLICVTALGLILSPLSTLQVIVTLVALTAMLWAFRISFWIYDLVEELRRRRQDTAALAVAEERLRFSRDLHDVVGRHLSAIAVTADLAATLSRHGDQRAPEQMDQVRTLAQDGLSEMRALVRGYREMDLTTEIAGSRSLLQAAGIEVTDQLHEAHIPEQSREVAAWVLREGVTNILRHSSAARVLLQTTPGTLELRNDGVPQGWDGDDGHEGEGAGLTGLRERLERIGGALTPRTKPGQFSLLARFPEHADDTDDTDVAAAPTPDTGRTPTP